MFTPREIVKPQFFTNGVVRRRISTISAGSESIFISEGKILFFSIGSSNMEEIDLNNIYAVNSSPYCSHCQAVNTNGEVFTWGDEGGKEYIEVNN
jgi:hypothetical protein